MHRWICNKRNLSNTGYYGYYSEQQLVSCDSVSSGCNGGWYVSAYNYLQNSGGSANETLYPYTAQVNKCVVQFLYQQCTFCVTREN
jgi:hypothetical protein